MVRTCVIETDKEREHLILRLLCLNAYLKHSSSRYTEAKIVFMGKVLKLKLKCVWKSYYNIVLQKVIITYKISKFSKKFPIILTENRK